MKRIYCVKFKPQVLINCDLRCVIDGYVSHDEWLCYFNMSPDFVGLQSYKRTLREVTRGGSFVFAFCVCVCERDGNGHFLDGIDCCTFKLGVVGGLRGWVGGARFDDPATHSTVVSEWRKFTQTTFCHCRSPAILDDRTRVRSQRKGKPDAIPGD